MSLVSVGGKVSRRAASERLPHVADSMSVTDPRRHLRRGLPGRRRPGGCRRSSRGEREQCSRCDIGVRSCCWWPLSRPMPSFLRALAGGASSCWPASTSTAMTFPTTATWPRRWATRTPSRSRQPPPQAGLGAPAWSPRRWCPRRPARSCGLCSRSWPWCSPAPRLAWLTSLPPVRRVRQRGRPRAPRPAGGHRCAAVAALAGAPLLEEVVFRAVLFAGLALAPAYGLRRWRQRWCPRWRTPARSFTPSDGRVRRARCRARLDALAHRVAVTARGALTRS